MAAAPAPPQTLERDAEVARMAAALETSAGGNGQLVVVEGPPGIGKSRLVAEIRALAKARGFARMKAVGDEPEQALPWGVVRQLVERSVLRYSGETRSAILAGPAGAALTAIDGAPDPGADEAVTARTLHALWWVAADLSADRPLLITVDDAHWADLPSLRFFAYLARRLEDLSVTLVIATRPPESKVGPLAELTTGRAQAHLFPAPLSEAAIATLAARGATGAPLPEVVSALHASAGGNPFYVGQLMAELEHAGRRLDDPATAAAVARLGPRSVSRALLVRLSEPAIRLAGAAAVLGRHSPAGLATEIAGIAAPEDAQALQELRSARVLTLEAGTLAFTHPVVREAILADLDGAERSRLHAEAARRLHAAGAATDRVAGHLAHAPAGTLDAAGAILRAAGREALASGDAPTAARLLRRALDETPEAAGLEGDLGRALLHAGRPAEARDHLRAAARAAASPGDRAVLESAASEATAVLDGPARAAEELRGVLAGWEDGGGGSRLVLEARLAMLGAYLFEGSPGSGRHLAGFAGLAGRTPEERTLLALVVQRALNDGRPAAEVRELGRRALADGALATDRAATLLPWGLAVVATLSADGVDTAEDELRRARAALASGGSPADFSAISSVAAQLGWRTGDLTRCEAEAATCLGALRLQEPGPATDGIRAVATRLVVLSALERGDLKTAVDALAEHDAFAPEPTVPVLRLHGGRAALALALDDPVRAREHAQRLRDAERQAGAENPTVPWRELAALAAQRLGDEDEAAALAAEQLELARRWGCPREIGEALMLDAWLHSPSRLERLQEAVAILEPSPARLTLAHALRRLGEALRVERRRAEAREPLRRAAELAAACGASALRAHAVDAFASLGDAPRKLMFSGLESLTASERRVAELAASGLTNRDIARELFVTPKTVENHLGRSYVKLGISGRRELGVVVSPA